MPTKKIADLPSRGECQSKEHSPAIHLFLESGIYEHTCPKCGKVTRFTVQEKETYDDESPTYITGTEDGI